MDQSEMMEYLERMRLAFQKFRSIEIEKWNDEVGLAQIFPWIFGNKCPLLVIQKVLDRGYVEKMEFYNFMYIIHYLAPQVMVVTDTEFPEPNMKMLL